MKLIAKLLLVFAFTTAETCRFLAQNPSETFRQANEAYQNKDFTQAQAGYERLIAEGNSSPEVHYNLGNTYFESSFLASGADKIRIDTDDSYVSRLMTFFKRREARR